MVPGPISVTAALAACCVRTICGRSEHVRPGARLGRGRSSECWSGKIGRAGRSARKNELQRTGLTRSRRKILLRCGLHGVAGLSQGAVGVQGSIGAGPELPVAALT